MLEQSRDNSGCPGHGHGKHAAIVMDEETARWYVENYGDHPVNRMAVEQAALAPDDAVLDIGCGSGTAARVAASLVPGGRVFGIDPSQAMLRIAGEQTAGDPGESRIEFREGHAGAVPLLDRSVDVALAVNSLHHWYDPQSDLQEILRVLSPGGRLAIAEEEIRPGVCGHGEPPLTDPGYVARMLETAGFVDTAVARFREGNVAMFLVTGRCPEACEIHC